MRISFSVSAEGISPGRRAGGARDAPGIKAHPLGLQRQVARAHDRGRWKATGSRSSSPTSCPSTPGPLARPSVLPNGMDGVGGLTQPHIPPGKTFVYECLKDSNGRDLPPPLRRDGADGDGHDGHVRSAPQGPAVPPR